MGSTALDISDIRCDSYCITTPFSWDLLTHIGWLVDRIYSRCLAVDLQHDNSTIVSGQVLCLQDFRFISSNLLDMSISDNDIADIDSHAENTTDNNSDTDYTEIADDSDRTDVD
jgi:hypothetical protein